MEDRRNTGSVTKRLYDDDAYIREFRAGVIGCSPAGDKTFGIELDMTAFFPEGGGQKSDTGRIGDAVITDVQERTVIYSISLTGLLIQGQNMTAP